MGVVAVNLLVAAPVAAPSLVQRVSMDSLVAAQVAASVVAQVGATVATLSLAPCTVGALNGLNKGVNCGKAQNIKGLNKGVNYGEAEFKSASVQHIDGSVCSVTGAPKLVAQASSQAVANNFTTPLQEMMFYKPQDRMVNVDSSGAYPMSQRSVLVIQDPEDPEDHPEEQQVPAGVMRQPLTYKEALMNGSGSLVRSKN